MDHWLIGEMNAPGGESREAHSKGCIDRKLVFKSKRPRCLNKT